jgi:hypothetical protein
MKCHFANVWQNPLKFAKHWQIQRWGEPSPASRFANVWQKCARFAKHWQIRA